MEHLAELPRGFLLGVSFALGACIGSFLNVVIHRLPRGESLVWPGSHCPTCDAHIPAWANVPLISYALLRARCARCAAPISARYPLVELGTALVFVLLTWRWLDRGMHPRLFVDWALASALIAVTLIDSEHQIIPNAITCPGVVAGLLLSWLAPPPAVGVGLTGWQDALAGVVLAGGSMWALSAGYERLRGRIGLGMGDVKLIAMLGAFLGLQNTLGILVIGSALGLLHAAWLMLFRGATHSTRIPFGPALAAAAMVNLFVPGLLQSLLP